MDIVYTVTDIDTVASSMLADIDNGSCATVVGLSGDLGAGKTTLVQAIAQSLGVQQLVVSPTFVIAKFYETTDERWEKLIHIDAYRIEDPAELEVLGWEKIVNEPNTLVIVEWPERMATLLPTDTRRFHIDHAGDKRHLKHI